MTQEYSHKLKTLLRLVREELDKSTIEMQMQTPGHVSVRLNDLKDEIDRILNSTDPLTKD